ncbi:hypothetical protein ACHAQH_007281 [Verticillium albo-atrum]
MFGGDGADAIPFSAAVRLVAKGGSVHTSNDFVLSVEKPNSVDLFVNVETSFRWVSDDKIKEELARKLDAAVNTGFDEIRSQAVADHEVLMKRVELDLGSSRDTRLLATDKRTAAYREDAAADPEFLTLNFNFGRHLLISSARDFGSSGLSVPANLQGIWNDIYNPPWGSKYTVNINTEMNYWLAEVTDLPETLPPLWDLLNRGREKGLDVAKKMYGCPGWVSHHNLDLWGNFCPHDNGTAYSIWPSSNLWPSQHLTERFRFSNDVAFLRNTAWPLFVDIATFFDCYLFEFEGHWASGPSVSPENVFIIPENGDEAGGKEALDISPTSDMSLLHALFTNVLEAASALDISLKDDPVLSKIKSYSAGLRPVKIGSHGQIQEWRQDYAEAEPGHRHISHLIAGTNLFHEIDRGDPFQIDSNFGIVAAVADMFLQSHAGVVHLMPAVSGEAAAGSVSGLVARGGFSVSMRWEAGGALEEAKVVSRNGGKLSLRVAGGQKFKVDGQEAESVENEAGKTYTVTL